MRRVIRSCMGVVFPVYFILSAVLVVLSIAFDVNPNFTLVGNLAFLEAIWLFINAPGAWYGWHNWTASRRELRELLEQPTVDPYEEVAARAARRIDRAIFVIQATYLMIGIFSAFTPPPKVPQVYNLATLTVTTVFIAGSLLLTHLSFYSQDDRVIVRAGLVGRQARTIRRYINGELLKSGQSATAIEKPQDWRKEDTGTNTHEQP